MKPKQTKPPLDPAQIDQVEKWILSGASATDVRASIAEHFPGADAAGLMFASFERFREAANFEPEVVRGWCFEAMRDLYRRMVESGDYAGALRAVKQIQEIARHVQDNAGDGQRIKPYTEEEAEVAAG